jgi:hypothetical protein
MMNKLMPISDFVLEYVPKSEINDTRLLGILLNYATFLKQTLTFGMFIPCDDEGNILEEPKGFRDYINNKDSVNPAKNNDHILQFEKAKGKVLFEGFEYIESDGHHYALCEKNSLRINKLNMGIYTIEDLIKKEEYNRLTFTPAALDAIGILRN